MYLELAPEQQQYEAEVYAYLKKEISPELETELDAQSGGDGPIFRKFLRQLGADGWMGVGWPQEYGGQGRSPIEQYIFLDASLGYHRLPIPSLALMTVGPTIMKVGNDEQKRRFLPLILRGELIVSIGYTEPESGTDLFSLKTTAIKDGDDYILNGEKIFTSFGHYADYFWVAARTDPQAKKHRGISIFMVDARSPGITIKPMWLMGDYRVDQEFFDNVRVPGDCLIGQENEAVQYMFLQLSHERVSMVPHSMLRRWIEDMTQWAMTKRINGAPVYEEPWVRSKLAEMVVEMEVLKLLNYRVAWLLGKEQDTFVESSLIKTFGTELYQKALRECLQILGFYGQLRRGSEWAPMRGWMSRLSELHLQTTFAGGTNEVMRDMVASMGLGLMKSRS